MKKKHNLTRLATSALVLALPAAAHAQQAASPAPSPAAAPSGTPASAGLVNDWLRGQSPDFNAWDLGGEVRLRWEVKEHFAAPGQAGAFDFRKSGGDPDNSYLMLRETVHAGYKADWIGAFVEGRDSSTSGDDRNPNLEADQFDLHQGYVSLGNIKEFPLTLKAGRQEMAYGEERLVGAFDWNNIGRTFDGIKLRYETEDLWVDGFVTRVVIPDDHNFDVSNEYDTFSGLYASTRTLIPKQETQFYFLSRNTSTGSPNLQTGSLVPLPSPRDIYTVGFRIKSLPGQFKGWDYTAEGAYQFGRYVTAAGTAPAAVIGQSLDQDAYAFHADGGYTFTKAWGAPRVGLEFNYASGDGNSKDNTHGTFDQMYPTGHRFSGIMDMYAWQNIEDVRLSLGLKPCAKVTATATFRGVWLANTADAFYQANTAARTGGTVGGHDGYALNPSYGSFAGTEADLVLNYAVTPFAGIQAGYGHFFVGDYVRQSFSAIGGASDADYFYLQTTFKF